MPSRMLRDWTDSEKMDSVSVYAERFFNRLIMKVDDYGRYSANPRLINSSLFPLKKDVRDTDVARLLDECQKAGLILIYEVEGKKYIQINEFNQRLRQKKLKYPPPDAGHVTDICLTDDSTMRPEEKRIELEEEQNRRERSSPPVGEDILFTIEHCITVAMKDQRWVKANKATQLELQEFNSLLERRGVYEKNPMDYKTHFANWKASGKVDDKPQSSNQNKATSWI